MEKNILVVEDEESNAINAMAEFIKQDWPIIAKNMSEAKNFLVGQFNSVKWECALIDMNFPGGTGKEIGEICKQKRIPFVYVTGVGRVVNGHHINNSAIEILNSEMAIIERIEGWFKTKEIWRKAYNYAISGR